MSEWRDIRTQTDIEILMSEYADFHDSCIVSVHYESGSSVDERGAMSNGGSEEKILLLTMHSQWAQKPIELRFVGVRQFGFAGWQANYFCDIYACSLEFRTDLQGKGMDTPLIVWSDQCGTLDHTPALLDEPMSSFVISAALSYRILEG